MPIKPQQHDLDMPGALVAWVPVLTSAGLFGVISYAVRHRFASIHSASNVSLVTPQTSSCRMNRDTASDRSAR